MKSRITVFMLLAASAVAVGQQSKPKALYIAPINTSDGQYLDERTHDKITKEFEKQCPDLVMITRYPGAVLKLERSHYGVGNFFVAMSCFS